MIMWISVAIAVCLLLPLFWLLRLGRVDYQDRASKLADVNRLPLIEAEKRARSLLEDSETYHCIASTSVRWDGDPGLPEALKRLFMQYERVEASVQPGLVLDRNLLEHLTAPRNVLVIGHGLHGADIEFDIGVYPLHEEVIEFHSGEAPDRKFGTYTSVFHLLLAAAQSNRIVSVRQ